MHPISSVINRINILTRNASIIFACAAVFSRVPSGSGAVVAPAVPGTGWLEPAEGTESNAAAELLLGELNCFSCHAASDAIRARIPTKQAPDLDRIGARIAPSYLERFLADPQSMKPGATMPNVFHASENAAADPVIDYLTHFLIARGGVMKLSHSPVDASLIAAGEHLYHSVGCVSCHPPQNGKPAPTPTVPLGLLEEKIGVDPLTEFLLDPLKARPSGRMPAMGLSAGEARALAAYLLREQVGNPQLLKPNAPIENGFTYDFFKDVDAANADLKKIQPASNGKVDRLGAAVEGMTSSAGNVAVLYEGRLSVFEAGERRFRMSGGAGSLLKVNGERILMIQGGSSASEGLIPMDAGTAALAIRRVGPTPVSLEWLDDNGEWTPIPDERITVPNELVMMPLRWRGITLDAQKVKLGRQMFSALRCAACHKLEDIRPMVTAKSFDRLKVYSIVGCTGDHVKQSVPKFEFSDEQRTTLKSLIRGKASLASPQDARQRAAIGLARFNCQSCHTRDGIGGPDADEKQWFHSHLTEDVGEEGSLPPSLDGVGAKLRPAALADLVGGDEHRVRPYLKTRMPRFGADVTKQLTDDLVALDRPAALANAPNFSEESADSGRSLAGTAGLGCVTCHDYKGAPGVAVPGIDFTRMAARLNHDWFERFLRSPGDVKPGTRMPEFWPGGLAILKDIEGGDTRAQINALWNYISMGDKMPAPKRD